MNKQLLHTTFTLALGLAAMTAGMFQASNAHALIIGGTGTELSLHLV